VALRCSTAVAGFADVEERAATVRYGIKAEAGFAVGLISLWRLNI